MSLLQTLILCIFIHCFVGKATASPWKPCSMQMAAKISKVAVAGCNMDGAICDLKRGSNASLSVTFTQNTEENKAVAKVHGLIAGVPIPYPVNNPDACIYSKSGINCPLKPGTQYVYHHLVPVKAAYPKIGVLVEWNLVGNEGSIFCLMLNAQIVD
ncbi:NPC intracellular cholesterol transporter 2 homolog a-like [Pecten maximus]|uniref:NPC intracellular cholesterol transporter 2 homolog a-like n=1 Tax=Pecten maximus TaxID=6579 RepID=UPI001458529C|nr:NPC intracellular cholesterol transporter 2 homolog a-like [Pecten maximus]